MPRPKGNKNGTNGSSNSKFANAIRTKRTTASGQHAVTDVEPTSVELVSDYNGVANRIDGSKNESNNDSGNLGESTSGSGNTGNGSGNGTRNGSDGDRSGTSADNGTGNETGKRKRRTRAELDAEGVVRVKRPKRVSVEVEDGVEASTLLLSGTLQGLCEVVATVTVNPLYKINSSEGNELAVAIQDCMSSLPKAALKKYNAYMQKIRPWQNLAVVLTKVIYPRYVFAQMQKEANVQTQVRNVTEPEQSTRTSENSFNGYAQTDERASD